MQSITAFARPRPSLSSPARRRRCATAAVTALVASLAVALPAALTSPARADTKPRGNTPATVSANALPTVQQDGVVWAQVVVRNAVYATGQFGETWPAGQTHTTANQTARSNLLNYNITDGRLFGSAQTLNAQGLGIAKSPDGNHVYVVGDFTRVNGLVRNHIVSIDTRTGKVDSAFHPNVSGRVRTVTATSTAVYFGGDFTSVDGQARARLAAVRPSDGALYNWKPTVKSGFVAAMTLTPDKTRVIVGGRFSVLNSGNQVAMGSVGALSGAIFPWAINRTIHEPPNAQLQCGITTLYADGTNVYGGGFANGCGQFEGTFAASPNTGNIVWINDCHGDTYSVFATGRVMYAASHAHDCSAPGQFPDTTNPRVAHHILAWTTYATGRNNANPDDYGWFFNNIPDSGLLQFYPTLAIGTVTHLNQAAWSVTGNTQFIAVGGEFPKVNGYNQAGLTRFAIASQNANTKGPMATTRLTPTLTRNGTNSVRVSWGGTWDMDNQYLGYRVYRDNGTTPICPVIIRASNFWQIPTGMTCTDTNAATGTTHKYTVKAADPFNNTASGTRTGP